MKKALTLLFAVSTTAATIAVPAAAREPDNRAAEIGQLMQAWQSRILISGLPVDDAKNWSLRNMAKFSRLNAERLGLAQRASTLSELELVLLDSPLGSGTRLDVLMANHPGDITMVGARSVAKSSPATTPSAYAGLVFTALTTCRILDSRPSQGGFGQWIAGSSNLVKIGPYSTGGGGYASGPGAQGGSSTSCGLDTLSGPGQVAVIMAAVSTVSQAGPGYLTFYPQGAPNPGTTSVSQWYQPGYVQTSFVLIPSDLVGAVAASGFTSAGTEVIIDVVGYFAAATSDGNIALVHSTASTGNILKDGVPFIHDYGSQNTFVGESSGNFTMTGGGNTAIGTSTFFSNTTGGLNTASGLFALASNTIGSGNTASGYIALGNNTSGGSDTATGMQALYQNSTGGQNTAFGTFALFSNTIGNFNTASGASALSNNTTGGQNTASGASALTNTTGNSNIALGYGAGSNLTTGSFDIAIGNAGVAAESGTTRIGDGNQTRTFISGIRGVTTGSADAVSVLIDSNGQLGTISSSRRFKDDIADMDAASSALMKLRPVTFRYKTDRNASGRTLQYGLIAEEVAEVYPGLVAHSADGQVETVMYQFLPPMLLNEYQKQERMIEMQAAEMRQVVAELQVKTAETTRQASELAEQRHIIAELQVKTAEIAALKTAVAEIAELKQQTARLATLLDQQRTNAVTAGLQLR